MILEEVHFFFIIFSLNQFWSRPKVMGLPIASEVMARRVYRSRSRSADRTAESEWHNGGLSGADPTDRTAGGLRGWDDDSDDGKFQLKA